MGDSKKKSVLVGGIYRQHQLLGQADRNLTSQQLISEQEVRWEKIVRKWRNLAMNTNCVVLGDLNLNYLKWSQPDSKHENMINIMKDQIETSGFTLLLEGITRTWRTQEDSLIDHVWSNCPDKTIEVWNKSCGSSDYNVVGIKLAIKGIKSGNNNIVRRTWKNFDSNGCLQKNKEHGLEGNTGVTGC